MKLVKLNTPADFDKSVIPANNILLFVDGSQGSPVLTYKDSAGEFHTFCTGVSPSSEESEIPSDEPSISSIDPYLLPENIKYGVTIEGVVGTFTQGATATSSTILNGYTAYADGQVVVGTIQTVTATQSSNVVTVPKGYIASQQTITVGTALAATTYTPTTSDQAIAGDTYITGVQTIKGDANLVAGNIKSGVSIFGVTGTYTSGATATPSTILSGYTAYANGELITGEYVCPETSSESSAAVEEDVILGVVDAQGKFQPFSFSGTTPTNSGTAETVSNYNTWNSTLPAPPPSGGSMDFYRCATVDTVNLTWTGYKAIFDAVTGTYSFEATATNGLTYTSVTPSVGKVYADGALIEAKLYKGMPTDYIFYAPLTTSSATAETGQSISYSNEVFTTLQGIDCLQCSSGVTSASATVSNIPQGAATRTISFWGYAVAYTSDWMAFLSYGTDSPNEFLAVRTNNNNAGFGFSYNDHDSGVDVSGTWHHYAFIYSNGIATLYIDGSSVLSASTTIDTQGTTFNIGAGVNTATGLRGYIAAVRIYDRALTVEEVGELATEFTPTAS